MHTVRKVRYQPTPIPLSSAPYMNVVRLFQFSSYAVFHVVIRIIAHRRVRIELTSADLEPGIKYVIAANHQSRYDPYVITCELPLGLFRRLGPFRLFAHIGLFTNPIVGSVIKNSGSFPTRDFRGLPYGIEAARAYLGRNQTVVIFPEGRRSIAQSAPARSGVGLLAEDPTVRIIPAHLRWRSGFRRRAYRLTIGKPLPPTASSQAILEAIYALELPK